MLDLRSVFEDNLLGNRGCIVASLYVNIFLYLSITRVILAIISGYLPYENRRTRNGQLHHICTRHIFQESF